MKFRQPRWFFAGACCLLATTFPAVAHDPYEVTALMVVFPDRMELRVSAGSDVARLFLRQTGFTPRQVSGMTRGMGSITKLDSSVPPRLSFFEIHDGAKSLEPQSWEVRSADTEIQFIAQYARPAPAVLEVRALYFSVDEHVLPGLFAAISTMKELSAAVLSSKNSSLSVTIPPPESTEVAAHAPSIVPHLPTPTPEPSLPGK